MRQPVAGRVIGVAVHRPAGGLLAQPVARFAFGKTGFISITEIGAVGVIGPRQAVERVIGVIEGDGLQGNARQGHIRRSIAGDGAVVAIAAPELRTVCIRRGSDDCLTAANFPDSILE